MINLTEGLNKVKKLSNAISIIANIIFIVGVVVTIMELVALVWMKFDSTGVQAIQFKNGYEAYAPFLLGESYKGLVINNIDYFKVVLCTEIFNQIVVCLIFYFTSSIFKAISTGEKVFIPKNKRQLISIGILICIGEICTPYIEKISSIILKVNEMPQIVSTELTGIFLGVVMIGIASIYNYGCILEK